MKSPANRLIRRHERRRRQRKAGKEGWKKTDGQRGRREGGHSLNETKRGKHRPTANKQEGKDGTRRREG